jgi:hypothetical protein
MVFDRLYILLVLFKNILEIGFQFFVGNPHVGAPCLSLGLFGTQDKT